MSRKFRSYFLIFILMLSLLLLLYFYLQPTKSKPAIDTASLAKSDPAQLVSEPVKASPAAVVQAVQERIELPESFEPLTQKVENVVTQSDAGNLFGEVVDGRNQRPVPHADLFFYPESPSSSGYRYQSLADSQGQFAVDLPEGQYYVWASLGTLSSSQDRGPNFDSIFYCSGMYRVTHEKRNGPIRLVLEPTYEVRVQVLSKDGKKPLSNALVLPGENLAESRSTDARGFVVLNLGEGIWKLSALKEGYQLERCNFIVRPGENELIQLELKPGASVTGTIRSEEGQVLDQIRGYVQSYNQQYCFRYMEGTYEFLGLPLHRDLVIGMNSEGFDNASSSVRFETTSEKRINFVLKRQKNSEAVIKVRVLKQNNQAASGISIGLRRGQELFSGITDQEGRVVISGLLENNVYEPLYLEPKFVLKKGSGFSALSQFMSFTALAPERAEEVLLYLAPSGGIEGQVLLPDGKPASHALLNLQELGGSESTILRPESWRADGNGFFQIHSLVEGDKLEVFKPGYSTLLLNEIQLGRMDYRLNLKPLGQIFGKVIDKASGKPIPKFELFLTEAAREKGSYLNREGLNNLLVRDSEGMVQLNLLDMGTKWNLMIQATDYEVLKLSNLVPVLDAKNQIQEWALVSGTDLVAGRLLDEKNQPVVGAKVSLLIPEKEERYSIFWYQIEHQDNQSMSRVYQTQTNSQGQFRFNASVRGEAWQLGYESKGIVRESFKNLCDLPEAQWRNLELHCKKSQRIFVTFLPSDDEMYSLGLSFFNNSDRKTTRIKKEFLPNIKQEIEELASGDYSLMLRISCRDRETSLYQKQKVTIRDGETTELEIHPDAFLEVSGRAFLGAQVLANGYVALWNNSEAHFTQTDQTGHFHFEKLGHATFQLFASKEYKDIEALKRLSNTASISLNLNKSLDQDFHFQEGGKLVGRFEKKAVYFCKLIKDRNNSTSFEANGAFEVKNIREGNYALNVTIQGYERKVMDSIHVKEGEVTDLGTLSLGTGGIRLKCLNPELSTGPRQMFVATLNEKGTLIGQGACDLNEGLQVLQLPISKYELVLDSFAPFRLIPNHFSFDGSQVRDETFRIQPFTRMIITSRKSFKSVSMVELATGKVWDFENKKLDAPVQNQEQAIAVFQSGFAVALKVPEGRYRLAYQFEGDALLEKEVALIAGINTELVLDE